MEIDNYIPLVVLVLVLVAVEVEDVVHRMRLRGVGLVLAVMVEACRTVVVVLVVDVVEGVEHRIACVVEVVEMQHTHTDFVEVRIMESVVAGVHNLEHLESVVEYTPEELVVGDVVVEENTNN